jgi:hypothetical protein
VPSISARELYHIACIQTPRQLHLSMLTKIAMLAPRFRRPGLAG